MRCRERLGATGLEDALAALPAAHREAVRARIVEERDYEEIAREQGATPALMPRLALHAGS